MTAPAPTERQINAAAIEPLYPPWEAPTAHRVRSTGPGEPAGVQQGRRPSLVPLVNGIRAAVAQWRESFYAGASPTTRELLGHWFERAHRQLLPTGEEVEFRYHFCQREAIETLIYLKEVRGLERLSGLVAEFGGANAAIQALGITEEEDAWTRYAFKLATGAGKTKVMSLAIAWSYFHALREPDSPFAKHFVLIAPNLTVYERLKEDFADGRIFDTDPIVPPEWKGDWNVSTVLQEEAGGAATGGVIYLTNIHRLYDTSKRRPRAGEDTYDWMGPAVARASALDTGAGLRDRITAHPSVMVLNDEAHHVWDPDSAWNEAIRYLQDTIASRTGGGLVAQLDFTATPKDNSGNLFKHIVCDTPLGEAVDAGIVKTPIIGQASQKLAESPDDNAAYRWERHLILGYERWKASRDEWAASGKKPLLFVMCEDTTAADQIAQRLNTDDLFADLNGKALNLHTNLKGKVKKVGKGKDARLEFVADEGNIKPEDLEALRQLSRQLDSNASPYLCIVSVLMLREGWDVRNVTTIVPLRPYSAKANILPEQTLGRGLRRMTPPGQANETVTVIEHPAFTSLYLQELQQQGVMPVVTDAEKAAEPTTVSIFPDEQRKDVARLDIHLPALTARFTMTSTVDGITLDDVRHEFSRYEPLPLGAATSRPIDYEGRHLITDEVVERFKIDLPLLGTGVGAVSYFVRQVETVCKVRGLHQVLAPLIQSFLEELLFAEQTSLFDERLVARLGDSDVAEHVRAVFVPLVRARATVEGDRKILAEPRPLSLWRPFQVTQSERRPAVQASRTLFNLVPCNNASLEVAMAGFLDRAGDVAAFAKNAGPQALRIDFLASGGRLAFYTPDFFARAKDGRCYLIETKGRVDLDVPRKARAAIAWCEAATAAGMPWRYIYVPQGAFERLHQDTLQALLNTCETSLQDLIRPEEETAAKYPLFATLEPGDEQPPDITSLLAVELLDQLPPLARAAAGDAAELFRFIEGKEGMSFAPVFQPLLGRLDDAARALLVARLSPSLPAATPDQRTWFEPYYPPALHPGARSHLEGVARNLKKTLVFNSGVSLIGLLRSCMDYALNPPTRLGGVFEAVEKAFRVQGGRDLLYLVTEVNDFRNTYIAHEGQPLVDAALAETNLRKWVDALARLHTAAAAQ